MMLKICSPAGWNFNEPIATIIPLSSRGLRGHDKQVFIKRAGDSASHMLNALQQAELADDEEPVHAIALGDIPRWGWNRNGDGFNKKACAERHHTFIKNAKVFRHHRHKKTDLSYGRIAASYYSPETGRVDLLLGLNKTAAAAERNGGKYGRIADEELAKLAEKKDIPWSMGCTVPNDVCSACGNKAATRKEYCTKETCPAGGCAENLGKIVKIGNDLHHLGVDNPFPTWIDFSHVGRPAAPYAWGGSPSWREKIAQDLYGLAAQHRGFMGIGGAKIAEDLGLVEPNADNTTAFQERDREIQQQLLNTLGKITTASVRTIDNTARAFARMPPCDLGDLGLADRNPWIVKAGCAALAENHVVLPLFAFAKATKRAELADDAAKIVAYGFHNLPQKLISEKIIQGRYTPEATANFKQKIAAARCAEVYSLLPTAISLRVGYSIAEEKKLPVKIAEEFPLLIGVSPLDYFESHQKGKDAIQLAADYAAYKAAALCKIAELQQDIFPLICEIAALMDCYKYDS